MDEKMNPDEGKLNDEQLDGVAGGGPLVLRKTPPQKEDRDTSGDGRMGRVGALLR